MPPIHLMDNICNPFPHVQAFEEMLENKQGECKSNTLVNASKDNSKASNESVKLFADELVQVHGGGYYVPASEEVIAVEHLLLEPRYNDLVESVLGFDSFSLRKSFNFEGSSALEYGHIETNTGSDILNFSCFQQEKTANELCDGKSEGTNNPLSDGPNNILDGCEDYLLDTEFEETVSDLNSLPPNGSLANMDLDHYSAHSGRRQCGSEIGELFTSNKLVPETTCDNKASLLDEMSIDEQHMTFRNMLGKETKVTDKQWLKHRILFGLQNLDESENSLSFSGCKLTPAENGGEMVVTKSDELPLKPSSSLTRVFSFKTKPRGRHMKRERHTKFDNSLKTFSFDISKAVISFPDFREQESVIVSKRRLRRPTMRFMDESVAKNSRSQRGKFGNSIASSKLGSERQCDQVVSRARALVHEIRKKDFKGACIQVPFGLPVEEGCSKKKGTEFEDFVDNGSKGSYIDADTENYSDESQDFEEDRRAKKHNSNIRRKHHILWSLPEVLKLVEGVSKYGVGRWSDIKKVLFPTSAHRTSVDLKDKWRNLLRASCRSLQRRKGAVSRQNQTCVIPQHILHRVRELAVIYPYPRKRETKISQRPSVQKCDNLLPLSTGVV